MTKMQSSNLFASTYKNEETGWSMSIRCFRNLYEVSTKVAGQCKAIYKGAWPPSEIENLRVNDCQC